MTVTRQSGPVVAGGAKALARELVRGLWVAMPTPFTPDAQNIDEDLLARAVEHYIDSLGVDGIFCGGMMGEFWALSMPERMRLHELVARQAAGRVPVMAHVGHHVLSDAVALCRHAGEHGIEFGIATGPYYPPSPSEAMVRRFYAELAGATPLPLFLFNTSYAGYRLSPELIAELADLETVCGIKNPQGAEHLLRVQQLAGQKIVVTDASEGDWLDLHLDHGIQALMSTPAVACLQTAGAMPIRDYTRAADAGDIARAREIRAGLHEARQAFDRWMRDPWLERRIVPIAELKAWLGLMGLPHGPVRAPLVELDETRRVALRADLERLELVR